MLEQEYESSTQGIIVRSKVNWVEKGEKNNKYFLNLKKANKNKSTIRSIVRGNAFVKDQKTISNEIKEFY